MIELIRKLRRRVARTRPLAQRRRPFRIAGELAAGIVVVPSLLSFAEPVSKAATVKAWMKHIMGVLICGALIALGNWIYTLFSAQWSQAGMPDLPPMVARPGGGGQVGPIANQQQAAGSSGMRVGGVAVNTTATRVQTSFLDEYRD